MVNCFPKDLHLSFATKEKAVEVGFSFTDIAIEDLINNKFPDWQVHSSVGDYLDFRFQEVLDQYNRDNNVEMAQAVRAVFSHTLLEVGSNNGCGSVYELELCSFKNYVDLKGHINFVPDKYSKIVDAIEGDVPKEWILKKHEVIKVEKTLEEKGNLAFNVSCTNGESFACDIAVITVSLEVLKTMCGNRVFQPSLNTEKTAALKDMCLSKVVKLFFKFQSPIDPDVGSFCFYPKANAKRRSSVTVANGWDASKSTPCHKKGTTITEDVYNDVHVLERISNSDWWLLWLHENLVPNLKTLGPFEFLTKLLLHLSDTYEEFPKDLRVDPTSPIYNDWTNDPFYKGGYSFIRLGGNSRDNIPSLQEPVVYGEENQKKIHLLFSGEMTSPEFYSTTHSGYVCGLREAERIIDIFRLQ